MKSRDIFSDTLIVKYDDNLQSLLIIHPDENVRSRPIVQIRAETLRAMDLQAASEFIGAKFIVFIPQLQDIYKNELYIEDMERHLDELDRSRGKTPD